VTFPILDLRSSNVESGRSLHTRIRLTPNLHAQALLC
jgi:hypothetical protein